MLKILVVAVLSASLSGSAGQHNRDTWFLGTVNVGCVNPASSLFKSLRARKWREMPVWEGLALHKNMVQLWTAKNSWTITIQPADVPNTACVLWSGEDHEFLKAIRGEQT